MYNIDESTTKENKRHFQGFQENKKTFLCCVLYLYNWRLDLKNVI